MDSATSSRSTSVLSLGLFALLGLFGSRAWDASHQSDSADQVNRYQIRVVSQSTGATAVVMVDSMTGEVWGQRLSAGKESNPWYPLGKPE